MSISVFISLWNEVGDEAFVARLVFAHADDGVADAGVLAETGFDFAQFDAEAAQFDLVVDATEELDTAVGQISCLITGVVHWAEAPWEKSRHRGNADL